MTTKNIMETIEWGRRKRKFRGKMVTGILFAMTILLCIAMLFMGNTFYPPDIVWRVLRGEQIQGATFAIQTLRLPRMLAGLLTGFSFGMAGSVFQILLRNPLASPNIIGITSGSSAAAVFCILVLKISGTTASFMAVVAGLLTTGLIYALSNGGGFSGGKLILIGIGIQAMLNALISYMLLKAATNDVSSAMRWLSGSLNNIVQKDLIPLLISMIICCPIVIILSRSLQILELGDTFSVTLGLPVQFTRVALILASVFLLSFATAATGPIAFVAFLAGPIAKQLVGAGFSTTVPAGLTGAVLVLTSDLIGQFAFSVKYPVGVITGIIGAPYLLFLLIQMNRKGEME